MTTRRKFIKYGAVAGAGAWAQSRFGWLSKAYAAPLAFGLSDPAVQPKFVEYAPNALDPGFIFEPVQQGAMAGNYNVYIREAVQQTGLRRNGTGKKLDTKIWGYGYDDNRGVTWPGRTFQVVKETPTTVRWNNDLGRSHLLPVDDSLHWCYSLPGYENYSIKKNGVPIVTHLHGGHTDFQFDGNPEFFWSPDYEIYGPQWAALGGIQKDFLYHNDQDAGNLWYHDHALGITRLNVYAGLAGFYFIRDGQDTGASDNPLGLPAWPYELAYAIQDRMFTKNGDLFYPAFPGDPAWADFITGEGLNDDEVPQPSALAEFFGDHMVVNGKIWPKTDVEPRNYRMRLLNGTDSRFMVLQFVAVGPGVTDPNDSSASAPLDFCVIGSDQGLGTPRMTNTLVFEPGARYDIVVDFSDAALEGKRVIMKNLGGDAPFGGAFGGDLDPDDLFPNRQTDRIMAFDVVLPLDTTVADNFDPDDIVGYSGNVEAEDNVRRVALFEGTDEYGRLQPLLGTVKDGNLNTMDVASAYTWFQPTTENPGDGDTEIWEIYNFTADAHPIHLHLVNFQILDRQDFEYDVTGTKSTPQHNGLTGEVPEISNIDNFQDASVGDEYFEAAPKDMVISLPGDPEGSPTTGQMVRIKATFDKPGRYVWHCHILSHEDHEMMRVLEVGP